MLDDELTPDAADVAPDDLMRDIRCRLERLQAGGASALDAAAAFRLIQDLRYQADKYERDLVRSLRWDKDGKVIRTWAQVADAVQAQLGSRQAAHARWSRLKSPARRTTTGDARRGGAQPGKPKTR